MIQQQEIDLKLKIEVHTRNMKQIADDYANSRITLSEAAKAEAEELKRFQEELKNVV